MPHKYFTLPSGTYTVEEALERSLEEWDRPDPYTYPLLQAMIQRDQRESFTPSKFWGCDRSLYLRIKEDYAVNPEKAFARLRGSMFHGVMEAVEHEKILTEIDLTRAIEVDGVWRAVTGRADLIMPEHGLIADYKTTARLMPQYYPKPDDVGKMRLYAWMAQAHGMELNKAELVYIEIATGRSVRSRIMLRPADEDWIKFRIRQIQATYEGEIAPVLDAEDSWLCSYCDVSQQCVELAEKRGELGPILDPKERARLKKAAQR